MEAELRTKLAEICKWGAEIEGSKFDPFKWAGKKDDTRREHPWIEWVEEHRQQLKVDLSVRKAEANAWIANFSRWFNSKISRYDQECPGVTFNHIVEPQYFTPRISAFENDGSFRESNLLRAIETAKDSLEVVRGIRDAAWEIEQYHQQKRKTLTSDRLSRYIAEEETTADAMFSFADYACPYFQVWIRELSFLSAHQNGAWKLVSTATIQCAAYATLRHAARAMRDYHDKIAEVETLEKLVIEAKEKAQAARRAEHTFCILMIRAKHRKYQYQHRALKTSGYNDVN